MKVLVNYQSVMQYAHMHCIYFMKPALPNHPNLQKLKTVLNQIAYSTLKSTYITTQPILNTCIYSIICLSHVYQKFWRYVQKLSTCKHSSSSACYTYGWMRFFVHVFETCNCISTQHNLEKDSLYKFAAPTRLGKNS